MRPKSLLLLTLALGCGLVASIGISQVLDRKGTGGQGATDTEPIYIAKSDINLGDSVKETMLKLEEWPKDKIPAGAIRQLDQLVGRHPRTKIYQGEPILDMKLVAPDARDNPADQVPPGFRVVSVRVAAHTGGAGLLRPGDRVDVQLFVKKDNRSGIDRTMTKTILKEVRIFAVEQDFRRETEQDEVSPPRTVSLVVTPEQADKLTLATRLGEINLIIRNPDDRSNVQMDGASVEDLLVASRVDREQERRGMAKAGSQLLGFLKQLTHATAQVQPQVSSTQVASAGPWTMLILEGSQLREVQVRADASILDPFAAAAANQGHTADGATATGGVPSGANLRPSDAHSDLDFGLQEGGDTGQSNPDIIPFLNEEESD